MLASFQRYRAATSVARGSNGRTLTGSWSSPTPGGLGPRSEGPHGAFRSRSRIDCRLKGFHSARSHSSSQDCRCTVRTASSWSTLRGALHLIIVWPARWGSAEAHSCFGAARFGRIDPTRLRSSFDARCRLCACRHRLVNGYLTQMAPGDTTVGTTPDRSDVTEKVDSDEVHKPAWRPGFSLGNLVPVLRLPVILDQAAGHPERCHSIALNVGLVDNPPESRSVRKDKDNQPPHAEAQESSPGMRDGIGRHGGRALGMTYPLDVIHSPDSDRTRKPSRLIGTLHSVDNAAKRVVVASSVHSVTPV